MTPMPLLCSLFLVFAVSLSPSLPQAQTLKDSAARAKAQLAKPVFDGAPLDEAAVRALVKKDWSDLLGWTDCTRVLHHPDLVKEDFVAPRASACLHLRFAVDGFEGGKSSVWWTEIFLLDVKCSGTQEDGCYRGYLIETLKEVEYTAWAEGAFYHTESETKISGPRRLRALPSAVRQGNGRQGDGGQGDGRQGAKKTGKSAPAGSVADALQGGARVGPRFEMTFLHTSYETTQTHVSSGGTFWQVRVVAADQSLIDEGGGFAVADSTASKTCEDKGEEAAATVNSAAQTYKSIAQPGAYVGVAGIGGVAGAIAGGAAMAEAGPVAVAAGAVAGGLGGASAGGDVASRIVGAAIDVGGAVAEGVTGVVVEAFCEHTGGYEIVFEVHMDEIIVAEAPEGASGGSLDTDAKTEGKDDPEEAEDEEDDDTEDEDDTTGDLKSPGSLSSPGQVKTQP